MLTALFIILPAQLSTVSASAQVDMWWPNNNAVPYNTQPFKGLAENYSLSNYQMYWQVDNGQLNYMADNYADYPHKEADVNVSGWNWKGNGPYTIQFVAKDMGGNVIGTHSVSVCVNGSCSTSTGSSSASAPAAASTPVPTAIPTAAPVIANSTTTAGSAFYVDPNNPARQQYNQWQSSQPQNANEMLKIANQATAQWFGDWNSNVQNDVNGYVSAAASANATPILVAYNIPQRDCGSYSAGGSGSASAYQSWISSFAGGINHRKAIVILEPDAIAGISCLSSGDQQNRYNMISGAVSALKSQGATVYIDAGNPNWVSASDMASRLKQAGIAQADGFSLNVSNYVTTQDNLSYGTSLSGMVGGKHFVVDTSRNGNGPTSDGQWCNPSGRALGAQPTTNTGNALADAFLWVKKPGESDGTCNGGPAAGQWWADYALGLAQRAAY